MFLEFKVSNFRSIREEQTLSFIGTEEEDLPGNYIVPGLPGMGKSRVLKLLAIYGANASGKSNILLALRFLTHFAARSFAGLQPDAVTGTNPFLLDSLFTERSSTFELSMIVDKQRYTYGLALTAQRVTEEYLLSFEGENSRVWFEREWDTASSSYKWSPPNDAFNYDDALLKAARENCSLISAGAQFQHPQLTVLQRWFVRQTGLIRPNSGLLDQGTAAASLEKGEEFRRAILGFLTTADLGINDFVVEKQRNFEIATDTLNLSATQVPPRRRYDIGFMHQGRDGLKRLDYAEQSAGTKRYFGLAGPLIDKLQKGGAIFVDELETSLHPFLVRSIIELFLNPEVNHHNSQLIFTTHNPILLDRTLLRTDQIWFTEKDPTGATVLYPLTDYKQRPDEPLISGYLAGRFGGVPFIPGSLFSK